MSVMGPCCIRSGPQAASVFADGGDLKALCFPSLQCVTLASASYDVLQRLQVPNFDA